MRNFKDVTVRTDLIFDKELFGLHTNITGEKNRCIFPAIDIEHGNDTFFVAAAFTVKGIKNVYINVR